MENYMKGKKTNIPNLYICHLNQSGCRKILTELNKIIEAYIDVQVTLRHQLL